MSSLSRQQLVRWLSGIDITGKRVLDCGCGPEKYHARHWVKGTPADYHTLDVNPDFEPDFVFGLNGLSYFLPGGPRHTYYDVVFFLETAEHLWNPANALVNIHWWLKYGGELVFSAPFINPIHDEVDYMRLTDEWWAKAAEETGFYVTEIVPRVATDGWPILHTFYRREGLRMSKCRLQGGEQHKLAWVGFMGRLTKGG
jgi:SAM-dependent methyltransferase